jgi:hypothetical protein
MAMTFLFAAKNKSRDSIAALAESLSCFLTLLNGSDSAPPPRMEIQSG